MPHDFHPPSEGSPDRVVHDSMVDVMRQIGGRIGQAIPAGTGFALFVFQLGPGGWMTYISSAEREDVAAAMREWLERVGPR